MRHLEEIKADYALMAEQDIHTLDQLSMFKETKTAQIKEMEQERQSCRNQLRRPKPPEEEAKLKQRIHDISDRLKPMRKDLKAIERIQKRFPQFVKELKVERQMEAEALQRARNKARGR
jgi:DNA-binding transcriptional regulator GbsR (MarR family)